VSPRLLHFDHSDDSGDAAIVERTWSASSSRTRQKYRDVEAFDTLLKKVEETLGDTVQDVEESRAFRKSAVNNSSQQKTATYGRTFPSFCEKVLVRQVFSSCSTDDVVLDCGHGSGALLHNIAFTTGATAKGIELLSNRFDYSVKLSDALFQQASQSSDTFGNGKVMLRQGRLEDPLHRDFLTADVTRVYCNNFNETFGPRACFSALDDPLDKCMAGLFTQMRKGTEFVTLAPLVGLPPTLNQVNTKRAKSGLSESPSASFYELEVFDIPTGHDYLSFTDQKFMVYKYTKLTDEATFLCCRRGCQASKEPISGFAEKSNGVLIPNAHCPHCGVAFKFLRPQKRHRLEH